MWIDPLIWCICMYTPLPRSSSSSSADLQICDSFLKMSPAMLKLPMFLLLLLLPMTLGQTSLRGTELQVTTVISRPFIMQVPDLIRGERWPEKSINNWPRCCFFLRYYEGFLVDMLYELSTRLGFTFSIHENPEGRYFSLFTFTFHFHHPREPWGQVRDLCRGEVERHDRWGNSYIHPILNFSLSPLIGDSPTFAMVPHPQLFNFSSSPTFFYLSSCSC